MLPEVCEGRLAKIHIKCSACARVREAAAEMMRLWKEPEVLSAPQWQQLCTCNTLRLINNAARVSLHAQIPRLHRIGRGMPVRQPQAPKLELIDIASLVLKPACVHPVQLNCIAIYL